MADPEKSSGEPFASRSWADQAPDLARLPVGRHGLPREFITENQRTRLMAAALGVFTDRGYPDASVGDIVKAAGVSRRTFYVHFADKEACLLATSDTVLAWLAESVRRPSPAADDWPSAVIATVRSLTALLADDPRLARLLTVELLRAGTPARRRHEATLERLAAAMRSGRDLGGPGADMPQSLDCSLVAGAISILTRRVVAGEAGGIAGLGPELSEILLAPYLGPVDAHELVASADWFDLGV